MTTLETRPGSAPSSSVLGADPRVVTIASDSWQLDVLPGTGASVAAGRVRTGDGVWRDLLRPTRRASLGEPEKCASFPMVPWSNRIRDGVLRFSDRRWQLQRNAADGTAIHGASRYADWTVASRTTEAVTLTLDSTSQVGVNFPWQFAASVTYAVAGRALSVTTTVRNVDVVPFPAGFGHHPYFERSLSATDAAATGGPVLHVPARAGYALRAGMALGAAGPVPARADFRAPRPLGTAFVDDVLTAREPGVPVTIAYDELTVELHADPLYSHVIVYAPRGRSYFAVEPATNVNDGFALFEAGVPGTGVFVLAPGEERTATFSLALR
ncbi:aldose epimerase family protein [Cellulomonas alba]|uniref:Aldose epimerase n=1 Tax=Cellulomonas alba TaxID=3053467 RepID=A0ABT7SH73_9CELL|nr:aldose epimerase [Cellulomonas alba]MDM7854879.1 aldose epimerase [Cellulomonas alba]